MTDFEQLHPERMWSGICKDTLKEVSETWRKIHNPDFDQRSQIYMKRILDRYKTLKTDRQRVLLLSLAFFPLVEYVREESPEKSSFSALTVMPHCRNLMQAYHKFLSPTGEFDAKVQEIAMTSLIMFFTLLNHQDQNKPIYVVSPGLEQALSKTVLRHYPVDMLELPFPCIYVTLPERYKIRNEMTGEHVAEGAYITEDRCPTHRSWRILMVGKGKNTEYTSVDMDDALWHYIIEMPSGKDVEYALEHTLTKFLKSPGKEEKILVDGKEYTTYRGYPDEATRKKFEPLLEEAMEVFRYLMNVVIYATSTDADSVFMEASREYRKLKDRALKAQGKKRKELFSRLAQVEHSRRIVLGNSIVIDRKLAEGEAGESREGRKMKVRTYVAGYWNHYWVGEGRTQRVVKLVRPHFRGPEAAPLTENRRILK